MDRVIALIDMDCFYVQVGQREQPDLKGKPCAVVQYGKYKGGLTLAVGYEARALGVTRFMFGDDVKAKHPEVNLIYVPEVCGKADLAMFREAGAEVIKVLCQFGSCVERSSVDEAYVDLTELVDRRLAQMSDSMAAGLLPNTFVVGWEGGDKEDKEEQRSLSVQQWLETLQSDDEDFLNDSSDVPDHKGSSFPPDLRLAMGAVIAEEMRAQVYADTGFRCSAGIAHNKMLAKLACVIHKPNRQTVLPQTGVNGLFRTLPIKKIRYLGGKFGACLVEELGVENMADIQQFSKKCLQEKFGDKDGAWVYDLCRGYDHESVSDRNLPKTIGAGRNFNGKDHLDTKEKVRYWLNQLCKEVARRLLKDREENGRVAKNITVSATHRGPQGYSASKTCAIVRYDAEKLTEDTYLLASKLNQAGPNQSSWIPALNNLQVIANKFMDISDSGNIKNYFSSNHFPSQICNQLNSQMNSFKSITPTKKSADISASFSRNATKKNDWWNKQIHEEIWKSTHSPTTSPEASSDFRKLTPVKCGKSPDKGNSFFQRYQEQQQMRHSSLMVSPPKGSTCSDYNGYKYQTVIETSQDKETQENCQSTLSPSTSSELTPAALGKSPEKSKSFFQRYRERQEMRNISPVVSPQRGGVLSNHNDRHRQETYLEGHHGESSNVINSRTALDGTLPACDSGDILGDSCTLNIKHDLDIFESRCTDMSGYDAADYFPCERCHENVLVWHLEEHMDFHMACDLQHEERHRRSTELYSGNQTGTKRKSVTTENNKSNKRLCIEASKNSQKIDRFFKR